MAVNTNSKIPPGKRLAFNDRKPLGGPSLEDARRQMIEAAEFRQKDGKVPTFIEAARQRMPVQSGATTEIQPEPAARGTGGNTTVVQEVVNSVEEVIEAQPEVPPVETAAAPEPKVEARVETLSEPRVVEEVVSTESAENATDGDVIDDEHFRITINRAGRDWVAELTFKNGAGAERFQAPNYRELIRKLTVAKANATLKIRRLVEIERLGRNFDSWDVFANMAFKDHGVSAEEYQKMPEAAQNLWIDQVQAVYAQEFLDTTPGYYKTPENFRRLVQYLNKEKKPMTLRNLKIAYRDLTDDELLELRPVEKEVVAQATASAAPTPTVTAPATVSATADSVAQAPVSTATPQTQAPVRKRGSTGILPGQSSAAPSGTTQRAETETTPRELSREELRQMDIKDLRRRAIPSLSQSRR